MSKCFNSFSCRSRKERQNIEQRNIEEGNLVSGVNFFDRDRDTEAYPVGLETSK